MKGGLCKFGISTLNKSIAVVSVKTVLGKLAVFF